MQTFIAKEIDRLINMLLSLSSIVETNVFDAVKSIENNDCTLASRVIEKDDEIDELEIDIEEECLKSLALYQPVATDLRYIVAILKINNDLERIGDLAVNIAERCELINKIEYNEELFDFSEIADSVKNMLKKSIDAFVNLDFKIAKEVCKEDDIVDAFNKNIYDSIKEKIQKNPKHFNLYIHYLAVSRNLERIADHTTNIAEDVLYLIEGQIVRHHLDL